MAFATILSVTNTASAAGASHVIAMPSSVPANALIVLVFSIDSNVASSVATPSGWTRQWAEDRFGAVAGLGFTKVAAGTEGGGSVTVTTSDSEQAQGQILVIGDWLGTLAGIEDGSPVGETNEIFPNPPSVTASWGAEDNLFVACVSAEQGTSLSGVPSGYTSNGYGTAGVGEPLVGTAYLKTAAASDDPGFFTLSTAANAISNTFVVRSGSAAPSTPGGSEEGSTETAFPTGQGGNTTIIGLGYQVLP